MYLDAIYSLQINFSYTLDRYRYLWYNINIKLININIKQILFNKKTIVIVTPFFNQHLSEAYMTTVKCYTQVNLVDLLRKSKILIRVVMTINM